ncbi:hypothetical protein GXW82_26085 [Streptacidiphilus sp. 4-A2]|nr:hypothetical protein [Streptacidiphilus sp. 4-A2]
MTALQPSTDETTTAQATEPAGDIQSSVREDLLSYADLGGFTLTPKTHAWYAAVDTITNPEEARAASTALAELRGRDLPATREAATRLHAETTLGELTTVAALSEAVALLHRVRTTLAVLTPAVFASHELTAFTAATGDGRWRKEHGVKLSWGQRRALRRAVRGFAATPGARRPALHQALVSAAADRDAWAALSPAAPARHCPPTRPSSTARSRPSKPPRPGCANWTGCCPSTPWPACPSRSWPNWSTNWPPTRARCTGCRPSARCATASSSADTARCWRN